MYTVIFCVCVKNKQKRDRTIEISICSNFVHLKEFIKKKKLKAFNLQKRN